MIGRDKKRTKILQCCSLKVLLSSNTENKGNFEYVC
jgi:hypothetical protein